MAGFGCRHFVTRPMAWPNPFGRKDVNTRTIWGYTFQLTHEHLTPEQADPLKHSYDRLGEEALDRINALSPPATSALPRHSRRAPTEPAANGAATTTPNPSGKRDLYVLLRDNAGQDEKLGELWRQVNSVPDWVDWEQIARGQEVFYRYGGPCLTGLAYQSLLGGMVGLSTGKIAA